MENVREILSKAVSPKKKEDSSQKPLTIEEMNALPAKITLSKAKEYDFDLGDNIPKPIQCVFCGKKLEPIGKRSLIYKQILNWVGHESCSCEKARKRRKEELKRLRAERKQELELQKRIERKQKIERLFKQSKLGKRFKSRTFENFKVTPENREAFEIAKAYADNFEKHYKAGRGLIFIGEYGTGKTHLAAAIASELIKQFRPVIFGTMIKLLGHIKDTYGEEKKIKESEVIEAYTNCDLLIIDDLGKEKQTEWVMQTLYTIINDRYEALKPIVITTNYTFEELKGRLTVIQKDGYTDSKTAEAIISRIYEMCKGVLMECDDYRKRF